jgi:hypothetical protein
MNPLTQASYNRQGIAFVVSRMGWYWNLSGLLLDENRAETRSLGLRGQLEKNVVHLYAKLLLYQMKSVCYYYQNRLTVFARDLLKLNDWDGGLTDIQHAEGAVLRDSEQFNTMQIRSHLEAIAETAKVHNTQLYHIDSAIQDQTRRQERIQKASEDDKCLKELCTTDPRNDKTRIENTQGGLLKDLNRWIFRNPEYRKWHDDDETRLLWIEGDPGQGKTMLLCEIIDDLQHSTNINGVLSYFFCQATDSRINSAAAVLRGLIHNLVDQQPSLICHVRKRYDHIGKSLFEDVNAWVALSKIFSSILQDPNLERVYLVIDALDECVTDRDKLLDLILQESRSLSHVQWIFSSRKWHDIEVRLEGAERMVRLCLDPNADYMMAAVEIYIRYKVGELARKKRYKEKTKSAVFERLSSNANGTFLWAALVCKELETVPLYRTEKAIEQFPSGLVPFYKRMLEQVRNGKDKEDVALCEALLRTISVAIRPLQLDEVGYVAGFPYQIANDSQALKELIDLCGSFLVVREETIYFVHQSAKDFFTTSIGSSIFLSGESMVHKQLANGLILDMSRLLKRDICGIGSPGVRVSELERETVKRSLPLHVQYACLYWVKHLEQSERRIHDGDQAHLFLQKYILYWLEAMSLIGEVYEGVRMIDSLRALTDVRLLEIPHTSSSTDISHSHAVVRL